MNLMGVPFSPTEAMFLVAICTMLLMGHYTTGAKQIKTSRNALMRVVDPFLRGLSGSGYVWADGRSGGGVGLRGN
jgi:hypothetical protein